MTYYLSLPLHDFEFELQLQFVIFCVVGRSVSSGWFSTQVDGKDDLCRFTQNEHSTSSLLFFFEKGIPRPLHQKDAYGHLITSSLLLRIIILLLVCPSKRNCCNILVCHGTYLLIILFFTMMI